jgi:hypothetical protein
VFIKHKFNLNSIANFEVSNQYLIGIVDPIEQTNYSDLGELSKYRSLALNYDQIRALSVLAAEEEAKEENENVKDGEENENEDEEKYEFGQERQLTVREAFSQAMIVSRLFIYPVKSCAGIELEACRISKSGFENDRIYAFYNKANLTVVNQLMYPMLCQIQPTMIGFGDNDSDIDDSDSGAGAGKKEISFADGIQFQLLNGRYTTKTH